MKRGLTAPIRSSYADAADFLRALCIFFIAWFHIWQQSWLNPNFTLLGHPVDIYPVVACGYMFVDLMLALSGFLLMLGFLNGRDRAPRRFYVARAARILPSYWFCLIVVLFCFALPGHEFGSASRMWKDLLSHLSFTHNLLTEGYNGTRLNVALWTLAVEVQFYLIFPLLARAFEKKPLLTWALMCAFGMGMRYFVYKTYPDTTLYFNRLPAMMDVYANGMLAAWAYFWLKDARPAVWRAALSTLLALGCCVLTYRILRAQYYRGGGENLRLGQIIWRFPLSALGGVFLLCGSRALRPVRALLSNPVTRFLSGISFNYYIWHQYLAVKLKAWHIPPYSVEKPNVEGIQPWQTHYTLLCFGAALALSVLLTYALERPCARWIKKRFMQCKSA